jgi:hypothetical protein
MNLSVGQEIQIKNVPVRYDGEGSNLFWFTLMVPGKKTSFCMRKRKFSVATISQTIEGVLARYRNAAYLTKNG